MTARATRVVPAFVPEALAASQVGTWEADFAHDHIVCDETTAALFGFARADAARGLPLTAFAQAIHPDDRQVFYDKLNPVRARGGLIVVEYRTCPSDGVVRWVLARGRYEPDANGLMTGRGIVIDITESKLDGHVEDRAFFLSSTVELDPLDRAADLAIEARHAVDEIEGEEAPTLRATIDAFLWSVGRALARRGDGQA